MLLTGCFCIGPGIDSRSAVLALQRHVDGIYQRQGVKIHTSRWA
jgi:hypothetical protein